MRAVGEQGKFGEGRTVPIRLRTLRQAGLALMVCGLLAAGCAPTVQVHGYVPSPADIARVRPGFDDTGTVEEILGRPSSNGILRDTAWYYVQSTIENYAYYPPRVIDRTVLAVNFDQRGVVRDIQEYGLEDGKIINLTARTTETGGRELGVLEQLFGNLLNLDAEQFQDN
jgi:outer membrane protein assembly factor BamE (lipoprotein component of BamABCDE complex)